MATKYKDSTCEDWLTKESCEAHVLAYGYVIKWNIKTEL